MPTNQPEPAEAGEELEEEYTICPDCGADLIWHRCPPREQ
jgi:hypothetical protein